MRSYLLVLFILPILLLGCAGSGIPKKDYSLLTTPKQTFTFAKKAVAYDDPKAFYYCLTDTTQKKFSLSDLELGWSFAGSFFYIFLESSLKNVDIPAPEYKYYPNTAKVVIKHEKLEAEFLFIKEGNKWKLTFPSPYPLPDISQLKTKKRTPWRSEENSFYRSTPQQWLRPSQRNRGKKQIAFVRKPNWRTE